MKRTLENVDDEFKVLIDLVSDVLRDGLINGAGKHEKFSWRQESPFEHLAKGLRHAMTYWIISKGWQDDDGDPHLKLALTRIVMSLDVLNYLRKINNN